jgi:hypothetical protein
MAPLSVTPLSSRIIKDCFKSTVEYTMVSIAADAPNHIEGEDVKKKIKVLHEVHHLEALLMWRAQFDELKKDKQWNAAACFRNAALLLSADAKDKWITEVDIILTDARGNQVLATDARFMRAMSNFMSQYCSNRDTEKTREMILSVKKPSNMGIRDFVARIRQLNRFLSYLPEPLNEKLSDNEIAAII